MTTLRQTLANQRNSLRSTGPKSERGKQIASMNAMKFGLAGEGLVLPDEDMDAVRDRAEMWCSSFRPFYDFDVWLVERAAVETVRADRCRWHEAVLREGLAGRAVVFWDEDREAAAAELALGLSKKPEHVTHQLRRTKQGADWLIGRWRSLALILESRGGWDGDQRSLALDLLGVPPELRDGPTPLDPMPGREPAGWLAELSRRQEERLVALRDDVLEALDARERQEAMAGLERRPDADLRRLRRYEAGCLRRLQTAVACLRARKRESMPHQPARQPQAAPPPWPADDEEDRREQSAHQAERLGGWASLGSVGMGHEFADPGALVAAALREEEPTTPTWWPRRSPPRRRRAGRRTASRGTTSRRTTCRPSWRSRSRRHRRWRRRSGRRRCRGC